MRNSCIFQSKTVDAMEWLSQRQYKLFLTGIFIAITIILSVPTAICITILMYAITGGYQTIQILGKTASRDLTAAIRLSKLYIELKKLTLTDKTVAKLFTEVVQRNPDKVGLMTKQCSWTFRQMEEYSNRVANYAAKRGLKAGDEVALFMEPCPEYALIWIGFAKVGVVTALINNNLQSISLAHSVTCVNIKWLIFSSDLAAAVRDAEPLIHEKNSDIELYSFGTVHKEWQPQPQSFQTLLEESSTLPVPYKGSINDPLIYIYTSGTTGLPKAAVIRNSRYITSAASTRHILPIRDDDVMYLCLPLYHTSGGILGLSQVIMYGNSGAIVPKFSASRFWDDCRYFNCTAAQYIGETCRYLLAQCPKVTDRTHSVRIMFGNGLRANLWKEFQNRFGITDIREFYGSTEGNTNVVNIDNRVGAVGFIPTIAKIVPSISRRLFPVKLIKVDEETGLPLRNKDGLCIQCEAGEPGEIVGLIQKKSIFKFDGYVDKEATKNKLYKDVCMKGDMAFASGDLLVMDELGYLYFKDRTGDTFRWKGENVSTTEVEGILQKIVGFSDCVVYGVEVPGNEGRAGMAAILDPKKIIDLNILLKNAKNMLPSYAVPLFIRLLSDVDSTGTYKIKKTTLLKDGYDINVVKDPIYFLDMSKKKYIAIDNFVYQNIMSGKVRV